MFLGFIRKTCKEGHLMDPSWSKCPICLAPIKGWFIVMSGKDKDKVYTFHEGKRKIGAGAECELRILQKNISRQHAILASKGGSCTITDLSSVTGTFVNDQQVSSQGIIDGDIIRLGDTEFLFKCI